ncbi:nuclear transport factor, putative [Schistosoma mansoni]|uniref:Nuclear transport factor 2 n=1 Tax=Schistosoma mansoni TaxID=6183 RepID=Q15ES0_SCHMA|nr:nuclear transport factor, putative [Schistosoma mansoni]ABG21831.1 nuclear transport factor 2-like protein [Schistosoma mansoni]|eukprot:XP_018646483.1 nuclear transport factor, putative [Schistosoma mansoni]
MLNHSLYPENYRQIGESFVMEYYDTMQRDRSSLKLFYHNQARMTYEGDVLEGQDKIGEKFLSLPANKIQVGITNVDVHPNENSVLIFVCGQVQCDEDQVLPFCEVFFLRKFNNCFLITDSMFRLGLHNF